MKQVNRVATSVLFVSLPLSLSLPISTSPSLHLSLPLLWPPGLYKSGHIIIVLASSPRGGDGGSLEPERDIERE